MVSTADQAGIRQPHTRSLKALDRANFFLADVRDGLGLYLAIYLLTSRHWQAHNIGIAMSVMGIATVILTGIALTAVIVVWFLVPETKSQ